MNSSDTEMNMALRSSILDDAKESGVAWIKEGGHPNAWRDDGLDGCTLTLTIENAFSVFTHSANRL